MRTLAILLITVALAGCVNRAERESQSCISQGFAKGTQEYALCTHMLAQERYAKMSAFTGIVNMAKPRPTMYCTPNGIGYTCQ